MKSFIAAVCALALIAYSQASVIPLGISQIAGHGLSYTAVSGPVGVPVVVPGAVAVHASHVGPVVVDAHHGVVGAHHAVVDAHHAVVDAHHGVVVGHPAVVAAHHAAHHHAVVAAPHAAVVVGPAHSGSYVAQTRGAVHTAPLPGHIASAANINVAPAPGTV